MFVIVLKSKITGELFGADRTLSGDVRRFTEYATAERTAYELNRSPDFTFLKEDDIEWVVKEDDKAYFEVRGFPLVEV